MKIFYLKLTLLILFSLHIVKKSQAQYVAIPDANFASYLTTNFPSCMNGSQLDTTCTAALKATSVNVINSNIADLTGIQYFKGLDTLICSENNLATLPTLPAKLTYLDCSANQLDTLPKLPASLQTLNADENTLTVLPALPPSLVTLYLNSNNLTALPTLPATLSTLECGYNQLVNLPALPATLTNLNCSSNNLTSLPALPATLTSLLCTFNSLYCLPVLPAGLQTLWAINNYVQCISGASASLTTDSAYKQCSVFNPNNCALQNYVLIPDPDFVTYLTYSFPSCMSGSWLDTTCSSVLSTTNMNVSNSAITDLTGIQYFKGLDTLNCSFNNLITIPSLPPNLTYLDANFNNLTSLPTLPASLNLLALTYNNVTCLPALPAGLQYLYAAHNHVACIYDLPANLIHSDSTYTICNNSLNPNGCPTSNWVLIPDTNFRKYLQKNFPSCMHGWYLDTTCSSVLTTTLININTLGIADLTGIQYFKGLDTLYCSSNNLTSFPPLSASLSYLDCDYNKITSLPNLPSIAVLICYENKLDSLPSLPASLYFLDCRYNNISCLPVLPVGLSHFSAVSNHIACIPNQPTNLTADSAYPVCGGAGTLNPNGCPVLSSTSVTTASIQNSLQVYPNPSAGTVTISCPFNATGITIAGMDGKIVYQTTAGNTSYNIDLSAIAKGVYVAQVSSGQGVISQKLVLQ